VPSISDQRNGHFPTTTTNPQLPRNLVLGTSNANTHMLLYENGLSTLMALYPHLSFDFTVDTTAAFFNDMQQWPCW